MVIQIRARACAHEEPIRTFFSAIFLLVVFFETVEVAFFAAADAGRLPVAVVAFLAAGFFAGASAAFLVVAAAFFAGALAGAAFLAGASAFLTVLAPVGLVFLRATFVSERS